MPPASHRVQVGDRTWQLGERTHVLGILNVTPDSFSDGGKFLEPEKALEHAREMVSQGAHAIDVGGESTRPGADPVPAGEELNRILPIIRLLKRELDVPISVDTYKHRVAQEAIAAGADLVNDISGLALDPEMARGLAGTATPVILGNLRGTPRTMREAPPYRDPVAEVIAELEQSVRRAVEAGISRERILIDPGIGFAKKPADNLKILARLADFHSLDLPLVIGTSNKSFLGALLDLPVERRAEATLASEVIAVMNGAHVIRTHRVLPCLRAVRLADAVRGARAEAIPGEGR